MVKFRRRPEERVGCRREAGKESMSASTRGSLLQGAKWLEYLEQQALVSSQSRLGVGSSRAG